VPASGGCCCRLRVTAPRMILIPSPMIRRSAIICEVTTSRAASVLAVMSPKPTVENTVTVQYSASVCVSGWPKFLTEIVDRTAWALANSSKNSGTLVARASMARRAGNRDRTMERTWKATSR
jgi:hypothetical protein